MSVCEKNGPPGVNRWLAAYTIVHGVEASPVERTAAGELQRYLETITGIRMPVTDAAAPPSPCEFLIGRTGRSFRADVAGLTDDGFARPPVRGTDGDRGNLWPLHPLWCVLFSGDLRGLPVLCPGLRGSAIPRGVPPAGCDRRPVQSGAVLPGCGLV